MVQDKNPSQDTVQKGGHTAVLENVSYDKDVVEIEPADAIDSAHYGGSFVKDVCVDEGRRTRTASEENPLDRRSSPNFSRQVIGADSDIGYEKKGCSRVSVHGLKPDVVSPAGFAPHCNGKECGLEDGIDVAAGESSEKKVSLQELLLFESAGESGRSGTVNSESCGKCRCPLHEDAAGQTSKDGDPDVLQTEPGDAYGRRNQETPGHTDQEHSIGSTDDDSSKPAAARVGDEDTYDHEPDLSGRGGPVSVSGRHPACSGSVSLRSDSSARSFAFPVLQGEWTGSPVRMAKAERRHSGRRRRRRRAWRKGIICCKF